MLFGRKKKSEPQTDQEILEDAFAAIGKQQTRRAVRKRRSGRWRKYVDRRIIIALVVIFVVVIADAVRRENQEFYATVTQVSGPASVTVDEKLADGNLVKTGANGWVALLFPDGSVVTLAPSSTFKVRLLEYHRGGQWRSRSFTLLAGRMWARVSGKFGRDSRCKVHTPSSVAAVRGTRFSVAYDPSNKTTYLACSDGQVDVTGFTGRGTQLAQDTLTSVVYGRGTERRAQIDVPTRSSFNQAPLQQTVEPDPWLKKVELKLTSILDLPLSILGIGKCSWAVGAADFTRRTTAQEALRRIHTSIEGYPVYPDFVDPFTLRELAFRPEDAERILRNFDGACIERYQKVGQGFVIYARARDRNRTPYKLSAYGVEPVKEVPR